MGIFSEFLIYDTRTSVPLYKIVLTAKKRLFNISFGTLYPIESKYNITMDFYNNIGIKLASLPFNENTLIDFGSDLNTAIIAGYSGHGHSFSDFNPDMSYFVILYEEVDNYQEFPMDDEEETLIIFKVVERKVLDINNPDNYTNRTVLNFGLSSVGVEYLLNFVAEFLYKLPDTGHIHINGIWEV